MVADLPTIELLITDPAGRAGANGVRDHVKESAMTHYVTARKFGAAVGGVLGHMVAIAVGLALMVLGLGLGVTMIMLPVGLVVGLAGVLLVVGGLFVRFNEAS
jgi:hypothetical protein